MEPVIKILVCTMNEYNWLFADDVWPFRFEICWKNPTQDRQDFKNEMIKKVIRHDFDYLVFDDFWEIQKFDKYIDLLEVLNKNNGEGLCFKDAYRILNDTDWMTEYEKIDTTEMADLFEVDACIDSYIINRKLIDTLYNTYIQNPYENKLIAYVKTKKWFYDELDSALVSWNTPMFEFGITRQRLHEDLLFWQRAKRFEFKLYFVKI